jgi:hypothetical protein
MCTELRSTKINSETCNSFVIAFSKLDCSRRARTPVGRGSLRLFTLWILVESVGTHKTDEVVLETILATPFVPFKIYVNLA